ncbi:class Ib ribonucleoside-diphosphate reductase assembly flavoprotein NrdI [Paenibacillus sp. N1-5-1-14]|uniref:class Ib ribonucleoside-diphosphate reductase assembly flavoprotein NrdI n=1 Tax=Paenibacillus radicibacter TaxID=2972488 RepID=UPI002158ADAA|nr:class Ib ribonucleoside-diphosphate reductase assembly flavoprotein NrdI [Paenibacillus radicibacter]MCR8641388.1 class Ib ribonucleoside-diphosphate reductase assembly flavoprotein NrdI [Paenibacillus radicibacter]
MLVVYDSKTGNVKRFVDKLNVRNTKIHNNLLVEEPYVLITYTTGFGKIPETTQEFLKLNKLNLMGVASSGNMNWGSRYSIAAVIIAELYSVPIIHRFELSGTSKDVEVFKQEVLKLVSTEVDSTQQ